MKNTQKTSQETTREGKKFDQPEKGPVAKTNSEGKYTGQGKQEDSQTSKSADKSNPTNKGQTERYAPEQNDRGYENVERNDVKAGRGEVQAGQSPKPGKNQPDKTSPDKDADKTIPEKNSDPTTSYQTGSTGRQEK